MNYNTYDIPLPATLQNIGNIKISCHYNDGSVQPILQKGSYEKHVQILLSQFCVNKKNILDVGANYGQHTVLMSKLNPTSKVVAIEASQSNIDLLNRNIWQNNCDNVIIKQSYVLDKPKTFNFYHEEGNAACAFGCTTDYGSKNHNNIQTSIVSDTLDNLIDFEPDFIKMDIEGAELDAINGAVNILKNNSPLLIELNKFTSKEFFDVDINELIDKIYDIGYNNAIIFYNDIISVTKETIKEIMSNNILLEVLFIK